MRRVLELAEALFAPLTYATTKYEEHRGHARRITSCWGITMDIVKQVRAFLKTDFTLLDYVLTLTIHLRRVASSFFRRNDLRD